MACEFQSKKKLKIKMSTAFECHSKKNCAAAKVCHKPDARSNMAEARGKD